MGSEFIDTLEAFPIPSSAGEHSIARKLVEVVPEGFDKQTDIATNNEWALPTPSSEGGFTPTKYERPNS